MKETLISNDLKCMTFSKNDISRIENEAYNKALEDFITEIEKQTTFYCGKDSRLREILEQLKK